MRLFEKQRILKKIVSEKLSCSTNNNKDLMAMALVVKYESVF
jgi:hypothetical protein